MSRFYAISTVHTIVA